MTLHVEPGVTDDVVQVVVVERAFEETVGSRHARVEVADRRGITGGVRHARSEIIDVLGLIRNC